MITERTNVSIYETDGHETMYMLDESARLAFIQCIVCIRRAIDNGDIVTPPKWNHHDINAITTMHKWLEEGRDFNKKQASKMFKAFSKIDKAISTMPKLCAELGLTFGYKVSSFEAHNWLVARRKEIKASAKRKATIERLKADVTSAYNTFFELYEMEGEDPLEGE